MTNDLKDLVRNYHPWQCDHCVEHIVEEAYKRGVERAITLIESYQNNYPTSVLIGNMSDEMLETELIKMTDVCESVATFLSKKLRELIG